MPHILVKVPKNAFTGAARAALASHLTEAVALAEQIPNDPRKRFLCWVTIEDVATGSWTCGGVDVSAEMLPCFALVHVPAGVLDAPARALCVQTMHKAFQKAMPAADARRLVTSVIIQDVPDGSWGGNGDIWTLSRLSLAAGYVHLQHLAAEQHQAERVA